MTERQLVIASNRGPVSYERDDSGELAAKRGGGGLVTALTGVLSTAGGLWVAAAMSDGDRQAASEGDGHLEMVSDDAKYRLRYLVLPPDQFDAAYNVISNRILWFLHHYLFDAPRSPRFGARIERAWEAYRAVNEAFAEALAEEGRNKQTLPAYLIQDYHLTLAPRMLRERIPDAPIAHFSHTPFAGPGYFRILPDHVAQELLRGMLAADVLGFHSEDWAENFLLCCRRLEGARVNLRTRTVELDGRTTFVRVYPISIDAEAMRRDAQGDNVRVIRRELKRWLGDARLILRVDRSELSKNILRGFLAHAAFLQRYPEWKERVRFLALLNPSRREIPEYRAYTRECIRAADRINDQLGTQDWKPIEVYIKDDIPRALAAYCMYDVLMVNPVFDGMNLVAMEGALVNRNKGVLILSKNAGAHALLGKHAIAVNPFDVGETADAIHRALTMPEDHRMRDAAALRRIVRAHKPEKWVQAQLDDVERAVAQRRGASG